jgi:hypothetical protein
MGKGSRIRKARKASAGLPPGVPKRPPWFTEEQYEAFIKVHAKDVGAQSITAISVDVDQLEEGDRQNILSSCALLPSLRFVCQTFASLDAAVLRGREGVFELEFVSAAGGQLAERLTQSLRAGSRLMPPAALTQIVREVVEWCPATASMQAESGNARNDLTVLDNEDFIRLVLSINGEQERMEGFSSWPPTAEELEKYNAAMTVDDDMVLQEMRKYMLWEFARMQANIIFLPEVVLGDTYDTWFKGWPEMAPHDLIGDTPLDAFFTATGVSLQAFMKLGLRLWERSKSGDVEFTKPSLLESSIDPDAVALLQKTASMPVAKYRKCLAGERKKGDLSHRRYTFSQFPIIEIAPDELIALRPPWVLDRFCGPQLYWETFAGLGFEKDERGEQFSQAMNYVFEANVGALFRSVTMRAWPSITLITETEMQQAWKSGKGGPPSVCDWVLVSGKHCLLVDATNHWLDEKAAQGFADAAEYQADVEDTFVNKKFKQLKSTIDLLGKHGWKGCGFDHETIYVPLVIVPNAGVPATVFADIDMKMRGHPVLGQLRKKVTSPGVLIWHELQVFEGLCEHCFPRAFVEVLAQWRIQCTTAMPIRPQTLLDLGGMDRPLGSHPIYARSRLIKALQFRTTVSSGC